jgi:hypothetical protein
MTIWTHRQLLKGETSISPEYDVGKFKGPVFLKIQLPPGEVDHYVAVALQLNDYAEYEYDRAGSWLSFASPRDLRMFVQDLYAYAHDRDSQEVDPEGCDNAARMANVLERAVGTR